MRTKADERAGKSYRQILKSTFIMGGSSVVTILLGIIRTKVLALLIGPSGVGLTGIYMSTTNLLTAISGMGIGESGVRQIAEDVETGNRTSVSRTVSVIGRASLIFGIAGLCFLLVFSRWVSELTFGNPGHSWDLALLSLTILFGAVSAGRIAVIQGMRRIADLAKINIFGALWGTVLSIPIIYFLEARGVSLFLLAASGALLFTCWWYARNLEVARTRMRWREFLSDSRALLRLGFAFMAASLMTMGTIYILRVLVLHQLGMAATGIYQAAANLSSVYVAVILRAMFTDFYPRLTAASGDARHFSALVNDQIEVGILLAVPGILATITLAPFVVVAFYSSEFMLSIDILRWQVLGVFLQVISWPMGYMLRAKGNRKVFLWSESFANASYLGFAWLGITWAGLSGVGMAFLAMNCLYWFLIYGIVHRLYGFTFSAGNIRLISGSAAAAAAVFLAPLIFPQKHLVISGAMTLSAGFYCFRSLMSSTQILPAFILRIRSRFTTEG
jgi:PST family polysaccharide transporter